MNVTLRVRLTPAGSDRARLTRLTRLTPRVTPCCIRPRLQSWWTGHILQRSGGTGSGPEVTDVIDTVHSAAARPSAIPQSRLPERFQCAGFVPWQRIRELLLAYGSGG